MRKTTFLLLLPAALAVAGLLMAWSKGEPMRDRAMTPLLAAAGADDAGEIAALLGRGADVNARDQVRRTPLMLLLDSSRFTGTSYDSEPVGEVRVEAGGRVFHSFGITSEYDGGAVTDETRDTRAVEALLAHGADVNAADSQGATPLMRAAGHKTPRCLELLLARGADPSAKDSYGSTALGYAAGQGRTEILKRLLDEGLDPNETRPDDGVTVLMLEASGGDVASVGLLLGRGARVGARDADGNTALTYARRAGQEAVARRLEEASAAK